MLALAAALLGFAAALELRGRAGEPGRASGRGRGMFAGIERAHPIASGGPARVVERLGLERRIARAGLGGRLDLRILLAAKGAGLALGACLAPVIAPAAPGRLALALALALPTAGLMAPDAWLERRARSRARALRGNLPDALDLLATATAAGRSPLLGLAEIADGEGPLARELGVLVAETSCGSPQQEAFEALRVRVPAPELAAMCGVIERSRRHGSPLAVQLHEQASSLRGAQRRRVEEDAARAAPKIQLAVALLLVPSVLLMIAAGLLANMDRFLAGI